MSILEFKGRLEYKDFITTILCLIDDLRDFDYTKLS